MYFHTYIPILGILEIWYTYIVCITQHIQPKLNIHSKQGRIHDTVAPLVGREA